MYLTYRICHLSDVLAKAFRCYSFCEICYTKSVTVLFLLLYYSVEYVFDIANTAPEDLINIENVIDKKMNIT